MAEDERFESAMLMVQFVATALSYFVGLVMIGAAWIPAICIAVIALVLCLTKLSKTGVKRWAMVVLFLGAINWLGILPLDRWGPAAVAKVDRFLAKD